MYSKCGRTPLLITLVAYASLLSSSAASAAPELLASPPTCVSLYRDQQCHQRIIIRWSALPPGHYCLSVDDRDDWLICWKGANRTRYEHAFRSVGDRRYSLVRADDKAALATVVVEHAWVYRGEANSAGGWRLF